MKSIAETVAAILAQWILNCRDLPGQVCVTPGNPELKTSDGRVRRMITVTVTYDDTALNNQFGPQRADFVQRFELLAPQLAKYFSVGISTHMSGANAQIKRTLEVWEELAETTIAQEVLTIPIP